MRVRLGTRGSDLALWQANHVAARLRAAGCEVELVILKTKGDQIDHIPLHQIEGKGFFTAEIEQALLEERIDLAVHSHKDLPSATTPGLVIAAVPERASSVERLLIASTAHDAGELFLPLRRGARVGTSAPRRTEQLRALRPDLDVVPLRGNVPTRVKRLREGRYDAIVLAAAGLDRLALDLGGLVDHPLSPELVVPAPGQGALALEIRDGDEALRALLAATLADRTVERVIAAERSLLVGLGGGCSLPLGVGVSATGLGGTHAHRARAFLGADHPFAGAHARWCEAFGATPEDAALAAGATLTRGAPTGVGPLGGMRVALTGSAHSGEVLAARLVTLGATVVREVALEVEDVARPELPARVAALRPGDALAVTSANAARRLAGLALPAGVRLAAVGPRSARALAEAGLTADVVGRSGARELALGLALAPGARVLFPCAEDARTELEQELAPRGVTVERLVLYRTRPRTDVALDPNVDARVYHSPSAVHAALAAERTHSPAARRIALGPSTAAALAAAGLDALESAGNDPEDVLRVLVPLLGATTESTAESTTERPATERRP